MNILTYTIYICNIYIDIYSIHVYIRKIKHMYIKYIHIYICIYTYTDDDVYINKLQREVLQNLWSEYTNNIDQPIWHK
jgi:hypothetical protein